MENSGIKTGYVALLLTVVSICVEALAILAIATASADLRTAGRYADMVKTRYELEAKGQMFLMEADEALRSGNSLALLPDTETDGKGVTWKEIWSSDYRLAAGVKADEAGKLKVVGWRIGRTWENQTDMGDLWDGK